MIWKKYLWKLIFRLAPPVMQRLGKKKTQPPPLHLRLQPPHANPPQGVPHSPATGLEAELNLAQEVAHLLTQQLVQSMTEKYESQQKVASLQQQNQALQQSVQTLLQSNLNREKLMDAVLFL